MDRYTGCEFVRRKSMNRVFVGIISMFSTPQPLFVVWITNWWNGWNLSLRHGIEEEPALQDALAFFVESGGGLWHQRYAQPLAYHKKRRYIRDWDELSPWMGLSQRFPENQGEGARPTYWPSTTGGSSNLVIELQWNHLYSLVSEHSYWTWPI